MELQPNWKDLIQIASSDIRRLGAVQRYSSIPVVAFETTDQHSYYVALYALMIHAQVYPKPKQDKLTAAIAVKALLHDMSDSIAGDVVRVFKYSSTAFKEAVHGAEEAMLKKLPIEILSLNIKLNKKDQAYVDAVVKAADFLSLYQYMRREAMRGNLEIVPFYKRMMNDIDGMISTKQVGAFKACCFYGSLYDTSHRLYERAFEEPSTGEIRDFTDLGWCKVT